MRRDECWNRHREPRMSCDLRASKSAVLDVDGRRRMAGSVANMQRYECEKPMSGTACVVQPECMDPQRMKDLFGDKLAFWGCIGTQTTMPFGTPEEVKQTVENLIATVGKGGGLLLAPTQTLEPDVPWANVEALLAAVNAP